MTASRAGLLQRLPRVIGTALLLGLAISQVIAHAIPFEPSDASSYTWAGQAWRETGNPYAPAPVIVDGNPIYRYAPWFAAPWMLLSLLPDDVVERVWALCMVVCAFIAVVPVFRSYGARAIPLGGFMLGWLISIGLLGNVQPAMLALLTWGVERRWGPIAIAACASLKAVPLLYAIVYVGRGEWGKVGLTVGLTLLLTAPMLLFEIPPTSMSPGQSYSMFDTSVTLWAACAIVATITALVTAQTVYGWLAAGTAVALALPRAFIYDVTFLLPGTTKPPSARVGARVMAAPSPRGKPRWRQA